MKEDPRRIDRRAALATLGAAGLGVALAACSNGIDGATAARATTTTTTTTTDPRWSTTTTAPNGTSSTTVAPSCVLAPEMTEGPYYLDLNLLRSDIAESHPGAPLDLAMTVVDADGCTPIADAS